MSLLNEFFRLYPEVLPSKMLSGIILQAGGDIMDVTASFKRDIYPALKLLAYGIASIMGSIGALRIYNLWQINGRHHIHIDGEVIGWVGASVFLFVAMTLVDKTIMVW